MSNNDSHTDLRQLWQSLPVPAFQMSSEEIRAGIQRLDKTMRNRMYLIYAICLIEIPVFTSFLFYFRSITERIGACLTILGFGFIIAQIWLDRHDRKIYSDLATTLGNTNSLAFYRNQLALQRDFHRGRWFWSRLAIFTPGPLIFMFGAAITHPDEAMAFHLIAFVFLALTVTSVPLNLRKARNYQKQINALDALKQ